MSNAPPLMGCSGPTWGHWIELGFIRSCLSKMLGPQFSRLSGGSKSLPFDKGCGLIHLKGGGACLLTWHRACPHVLFPLENDMTEPRRRDLLEGS